MAISEVKEKEQKLNLESITWGDLTWVNIVGPTEREMQYLAQNYPFHPLDLDDCLSRKQRPKIDEYKDYLFILFQYSVYNRATRVSTPDQVSLFIGDKYLITIHSGQLKPLVKLFRQCQIDEEVRQEHFSHGAGHLLYRILDRTVDAYFPILDKILRWMEDVEDNVFDETVDAAQELAILRRDVITQRRIIFPLRTLLVELENKVKRFTKTDISVYWGDLIDHMNKICDTLDESKEVIEVYKDSDYVLSADRLNRVTRIMTILGSIILPFLIISSIYGMNIPLPGGGEKGSLHSFLILITVMVVIAGSMLFFFRRKRWI